MKKLSQYGIITLTALAFLTAGSVHIHADDTAKTNGDTTQVTSTNKSTVVASNSAKQHSQPTSDTNKNDQSTPKTNDSFTAVAVHKGFEYNNVFLTGNERQSFSQGTAFKVFKVFKLKGHLVYLVQNQFGSLGYVVATQLVPIPAKDNLSAYKMISARVEVPANFMVKATKNGVEYGSPDLASNKYSGYFLTNQNLRVLGVTRVNNKLRYLVIGARNLAYISAYSTKPVTGQKGNVKAYHAALNALKQPVKTPKKHKSASHKASKAKAKNKPTTTYYTQIKPGKHRAIVQKKVVAHVKASFKDRSAHNKRNVMAKKRVLRFNRIVKVGRTYRLHLTNGHYVTANKAFVKIIK